MNLDLIQPEIKKAIVDRIQQLQPDTTARWGKMNVAQMLAHCQAQMRVALGDDKLPQSLMGKIFGPWAKKKVLSDKPYSHELPTAPSFKIRHQPEFEKERSGLLKLIERFNDSTITQDVHPFFGRMSHEQWSRATWKHLDHHLKQFGK